MFRNLCSSNFNTICPQRVFLLSTTRSFCNSLRLKVLLVIMGLFYLNLFHSLLDINYFNGIVHLAESTSLLIGLIFHSLLVTFTKLLISSFTESRRSVELVNNSNQQNKANESYLNNETIRHF